MLTIFSSTKTMSRTRACPYTRIIYYCIFIISTTWYFICFCWLDYFLLFFWFRIFGYGLVIKNTNVYPLLFSERMGLRKIYKIKNWSITKLKP
jgi:hypothetical protein